MTPEAQRIAIAKACPGLFEVHQTWRGPEGGGHRTFLTKKDEGIEGEEIDPLSDLNAMFEAEKVLTPGKRNFYVPKLGAICDVNAHMVKGSILIAWALLHATAAQGAEAFLRTLNLWDDSK